MKRINKSLAFAVVFMAALLFNWGISATQAHEDTLYSAHHNDYPSPTAIAQVEPQVPIATETVEYVTIDGQSVSGYFAYPVDATEPLPGIIAIHEWWGLNDNIKAMTRRLAGEGYQVLAVDLYDGEVATTPKGARQLTQEVAKNQLVAEANISKAYRYLTDERQAPSVGSIGWCFGGSWSLETALIFPQKLDAAVIYYGGQIGEATTEELATLEMPILGIFGAEDESIPVETVKELESTLEQLGKTTEFHIYENAGHAFANPSGQNYVPEAAEQAWQETTEFLAQYLQ